MDLSRLLLLAGLLLLPTLTPGQTVVVNAITGATVIDGTDRAPIRDAVIVIRGSRISQVGSRREVRIPPGARIISARGKFVIPGLGDAHNHIDQDGYGMESGPPESIKRLARMLAWGFTTIVDPGTREHDLFPEYKRLSAADDAPYPHYFGVGRGLGARNGYGQLNAYRPETPEEARAMISELKAARVDAVKVYYSDLIYVSQKTRPLLTPELLAAIIDEAHRQGLKVYAHAPVLNYAKAALRAGVDGLVHGILSEPVDDEFIALMKKNRAVYIPTFAVFDSIADLNSWAREAASLDVRQVIRREVYEIGMKPETRQTWEAGWDNLSYMKERLPNLRKNLKKVYAADILVVCGSDLSGAMMGISSQMEIFRMVAAGLTPQQAIQTASLNVALMLGREKEQGTIEAGKLADLLILDADPLADIRNLRFIHRVIKGGAIYEPRNLLRAAQ